MKIWVFSHEIVFDDFSWNLILLTKTRKTQINAHILMNMHKQYLVRF